ncbi:hypothetical protein RyT2_07680 [Pseudolactococcus yaeyamensis]
MITTKKRSKQIEVEFDVFQLKAMTVEDIKEKLLDVWKQKEETNEEWHFIADIIWRCLCKEDK